jgi:hypothetical protein
MGFASAYIEKGALFPAFIEQPPNELTGIIAVVPSYNEPEITKLLDSLYSCDEPECGVEVIIIVNSPPEASEEAKSNNRKTIQDIESWKKKNNFCFFRLFSFLVEEPAMKKWGVGLARKTGMDEAIRRFNSIGKPDGLIVNLDADCLVDSNYFLSLSNEFRAKKHGNACSVYFEHPLSGEEFPDHVYKSVSTYELYLRYFVQATRYTGSPYGFHTVGSAIAVRADAYVKAGGMNRRQAGEDFYFIQKLIPQGGFFNLSSTRIIPSPRPSVRVPFGTGASISRLISENNPVYYTYSMAAFRDLRILFGSLKEIYNLGDAEIASYFNELPGCIRKFITEREWIEKIIEIRINTSDYKSFNKRFFNWFNMFSIVKYMNQAHIEFYKKEPVEKCSSDLLAELGYKIDNFSTAALLEKYREIDRHS